VLLLSFILTISVPKSPPHTCCRLAHCSYHLQNESTVPYVGRGYETPGSNTYLKGDVWHTPGGRSI